MVLGMAAVKHGRLATALRREACLRAAMPSTILKEAGPAQLPDFARRECRKYIMTSE
jgi:hypothetical protein